MWVATQDLPRSARDGVQYDLTDNGAREMAFHHGLLERVSSDQLVGPGQVVDGPPTALANLRTGSPVALRPELV